MGGGAVCSQLSSKIENTRKYEHGDGILGCDRIIT